MAMKRTQLALIIILLAGLISSCKKDDDNNDGKAILAESTIIIDSLQGSDLTDYDTTILGFNQGASVINEIKVGSILVSGPQTLAPDGFLRRILSADTIGGRVVYTTEHAKFIDALEQAEFNVTSTFDPSEVIPLDSSVTITALKKEADAFQFLIQVELEDNANNAFTVDLTVNLDPSFELEARIRGGMYVSAVLNMNGDWEIKGTASTQLGPFQFRKPLFRPRNIARQTIWIPTPLAGLPFPVVINEDFVVYLVGQVSIDGSVTLGVTAEFESTLGVEYSDGSFNKIVQFNPSTPQPFVNAQVAAEGRLGIWPVVIVSAYDQDFGKIEIGPEGYLEASVFLSTGSQSCRLDYGVDLNISFAAPVFTDNTWDPTLPPIYGPITLLSNFCAGNPQPSCTDGIQNQGEAGIDCGGPCPTACPTATCSDGVQNQGEDGIDCGGPCPTPCTTATCSDGIQNQGETEIDCGGPCLPCTTNLPNLIINTTEIDDDNSGTSSGNGDGIANAGETIEFLIELKNNGTATATSIEAELSTNDSDINITDASKSYSDIGVGDTDLPSDFDFEIDANCPTKSVQFTLTITSAEGTWTRSFTVPVNGVGTPQFPMIVYNSGNLSQRVRDQPSLSGTELTMVAPGKKFVAKSESNGWYLIDIPWDAVGSPTEGWARGGSTEMQPTSGNCIKLTGTEVIVFKTLGPPSNANVLWIDNGSSSTGNPEWLSTDIDQHYVYSTTPQTYGGYTWYRIDLPNFCNDNNGTQTTSGWISGQYAVVGNCQ